MHKHLNDSIRVLIASGFGSFMSIGNALADSPAVPGGVAAPLGAPPQPGLAGMAVPFLAMFGVVYFLMIRPQQKKQKEQQNMLSELKHGDDVLTASGILGKVAGITDKFVTVEIADDVKVKMLKTQISQVIKQGQIQDLA